MIDTFVISREQADDVINVTEGQLVDVKAIEIKPAKLTKFVSGFANAGGGDIYIGIDEIGDEKKRLWRGFDDMEAANAHIQVVEEMKPLSGHYVASFLKSDAYDGYVLKIEVPKSKDIIFASDGIPYMRKGSQALPVKDTAALERLRLDKGIVSFEDATVDIPLTDVTNSETIIGFLLSVIPTGEPEAWLHKQNLIRDSRPTVAATLLFSDEPQAALPKRSAVKIYRYKTKADEGERDTLAFDPITVEGCLYDLVFESVAQTKKIVEGIKRMTELGLTDVVYPDETLHEIITNAVLHRDYSLASDIHIRVYDNRVEVQSPGKLPGHITVQNILEEQAARNPKLVRLINKFKNPPNKDVGEGLNTAFSAMKALRLKAPEIVETDTSVIVHIRHSPLASPQEAVMDYLDNHEEITNSIARDLTGIRSENTMKEVFYALRRAVMLEQVPGKRGNKAAWRKWTGAETQAEDADRRDDEGSEPST